MDDNYQAASGGGRKKGYDEEVSGYSFKGTGIERAERGCTDCPFLLLFLALIGSMSYITFLGFQEGDVAKLIAPLDGDNNFCGISEGLEEFPILYITDFTQSSVKAIFDSGVCVKECPVLAADPIDCYKTSSVDKCEAVEPYNSKKVVNICFPKKAPESIKAGFAQMKQVLMNSSAGKYINDLYLSSTSCYISIGMSVVYCLIYIQLMSKFAECIAWICVVLLQLFLACSTGAIYFYRMQSIEDHFKNIEDGVFAAGSQ